MINRTWAQSSLSPPLVLKELFNNFLNNGYVKNIMNWLLYSSNIFYVAVQVYIQYLS